MPSNRAFPSDCTSMEYFCQGTPCGQSKLKVTVAEADDEAAWVGLEDCWAANGSAINSKRKNHRVILRRNSISAPQPLGAGAFRRCADGRSRWPVHRPHQEVPEAL